MFLVEIPLILVVKIFPNKNDVAYSLFSKKVCINPPNSSNLYNKRACIKADRLNWECHIVKQLYFNALHI